jgi:hypothetical protein
MFLPVCWFLMKNPILVIRVYTSSFVIKIYELDLVRENDACVWVIRGWRCGPSGRVDCLISMKLWVQTPYHQKTKQNKTKPKTLLIWQIELSLISKSQDWIDFWYSLSSNPPCIQPLQITDMWPRCSLDGWL